MWMHLYYLDTQEFFPFQKPKKRQEFRLTESDGNCWGKSEKGKLDFTQQYAMDTQHLLQMRIEQSISAQPISKRNEQRIKKIRKD